MNTTTLGEIAQNLNIYNLIKDQYKMNYKYFKDNWKQEIHYFEVDGEGTTYRQIIETKDTIVVSNRPFDKLHFCLADQEIFLPQDKVIEQDEFEFVWEKGIKPFINNWNATSTDLKVGEEIEGEIEVLYPQGIIIYLNNDRYGIADYMECMMKSGPAKIYPGNVIRGKVSGYDDINLWVIIENPEVITVK